MTGEQQSQLDTGVQVTLRPSLAQAARDLAEREGSTLDRFVNSIVAVALSETLTDSYGDEARRRASPEAGLAALRSMGADEAPSSEGMDVTDLPDDLKLWARRRTGSVAGR